MYVCMYVCVCVCLTLSLSLSLSHSQRIVLPRQPLIRTGQPVSDSEAEFRFFWLTQKLAEVPAATVTPGNPFRFVPAPRAICTPDNVAQAVSAAPVPLDGLLFYHNEVLCFGCGDTNKQANNTYKYICMHACAHYIHCRRVTRRACLRSCSGSRRTWFPPRSACLPLLPLPLRGRRPCPHRAPVRLCLQPRSLGLSISMRSLHHYNVMFPIAGPGQPRRVLHLDCMQAALRHRRNERMTSAGVYFKINIR
jgi:hypothetical protein